MNAKSGRTVRQTLGNGRWFPGDRGTLQGMVDGFIENADPPSVEGRILSAIAPHAGYMYSGRVAGFTFRALRDNARQHTPQTVVVLGFSHQSRFRGVALMDGDAVASPLGETELDREAASALTEGQPRISLRYSPHAGEHSAENQIPFVQRALPGARLLVGLIGDHDPETMRDLVAALVNLAKTRKIVVVASSDMLHDPDYDLVSRTDRRTLRQVEAMDHSAILRTWNLGNQIFCGLAPVVTAMRFAEEQGCRKGTVLHYRNSGDDFPDSRGQWVVGYGAVVFAASGND